ncbi:MAG: DUF4105 domain-containing protein [Betaproteobacteria bacterium]|nr:DUF4105 domain-containing protein [Betaproteobacteria bacterium]
MRILLFLLLVTFAAGSRASGYADELVSRAERAGLAGDPQWLRLGHYRPTWWGGFRSEADDPGFFNSPRGKTDPRAELAATIRAFFSDTPETDTQQNPQCRFVARYHWLKARLDFDPARLPERPCRRFLRWRGEIDPVSVTLVFPAAYINSPASMYGHTLLRFDGRAQTERTRLLDYAVNFAAHTGRDNGLAFAYKGLFGGYEGRFSLTPYYLKITEYSDLESRDIWEYRLALGPDEIERLLEHVWELGPTRFDYYFLDENCSYQLLWLLDVASPRLHLTDRFPLWVIPADTIRAVLDEPGLVTDIRFRPSRGTQFRYEAARATAADLSLARALAEGHVPVNEPALGLRAPDERARVLDLAFEYLDFRRLSGSARDEATGSRLRELMLARARVDSPQSPPAPAPAVRPDQGHASARIGFGGGTTAGRGFQELRFRGAYHDLLDPDPGYGRGAQIEFGNIVARHENGEGAPFLERLTLIDVTSLAPHDTLSRGPSWRFHIGVDRSRARDSMRPLLYEVSGGAGLTAAATPRLSLYVLGELATYYSAQLEQRATIGAGVRGGVLFTPAAAWRVHLHAASVRYLDGVEPRRERFAIESDISLARDFGLRIELDRRHEFGFWWSTAGAYLDHYF